MSSKMPNIKISSFKSMPTVLPKKIRVKLVKEESELRKNWPADAILKWTDDNTQCEVCGKFFSNLSNLRRHKFIHNKEVMATFRCVDCHKDFYRSDHLVTHYKKHCHVRKAIEANQNTYLKPYQVDAINNVLKKSTRTRQTKYYEWALTPIEDAGTKPKKIRNNRVRDTTAIIPLETKQKQADPRVPTPITDEDALQLERYLEENTQTVSPNTHTEAAHTDDISPYSVTEEDDQWLLSLINGPSTFTQTDTHTAQTAPVQPSEHALETANHADTPVQDAHQNIENTSNAANENNQEPTHMTPSHVTNARSTEPHRQEASTSDAPNDPWANQPARPADPWQMPLNAERIRGRRILLVSEQRHVDKRNTGPSPHPWDRPGPSTRTRENFIVHNDELYLVLDELRG